MIEPYTMSERPSRGEGQLFLPVAYVFMCLASASIDRVQWCSVQCRLCVCVCAEGGGRSATMCSCILYEVCMYCMCVCVCVNVCMYVYVPYVCMYYVCMYVCICTYVPVSGFTAPVVAGQGTGIRDQTLRSHIYYVGYVYVQYILYRTTYILSGIGKHILDKLHGFLLTRFSVSGYLILFTFILYDPLIDSNIWVFFN
jgi:hypothetical protein